jgi:hypothetical protein
MSIRVGINGFGRIGRQIYRIGHKNPDLGFVAINDITDAKTLAHLLKYDSLHRSMSADVKEKGGLIVVDGNAVKVLSEWDTEQLLWKELKMDAARESTGTFTERTGGEKHCMDGANKVIISAAKKYEPPHSSSSACCSRTGNQTFLQAHAPGKRASSTILDKHHLLHLDAPIRRKGNSGWVTENMCVATGDLKGFSTFMINGLGELIRQKVAKIVEEDCFPCFCFEAKGGDSFMAVDRDPVVIAKCVSRLQEDAADGIPGCGGFRAVIDHGPVLYKHVGDSTCFGTTDIFRVLDRVQSFVVPGQTWSTESFAAFLNRSSEKYRARKLKHINARKNPNDPKIAIDVFIIERKI